MKTRAFWVLILPLIVLGTSCSGQSGSDQANAPSSAQSEGTVTADPAGTQPAEVAMSTAPADLGAAKAPIISARTYVGGSAATKVSGSFEINEDIAINTQASFSDGSMTWLQYGVSGAEAPNLLVTVSPDEVGITVGRGKPTATIGAVDCTGNMDVTGNEVTGQYKCTGVTSYDPRTGAMGKVDIEIHFTAKS